jgi:hypothetical protein
LFMAGYLSTAENWAKFSDLWLEELRRAPAIEYLKMQEAVVRGGQFSGWSERDRDMKLMRLGALVAELGPLSFQCSISQGRYQELSGARPWGMTPHFITCLYTVLSVAGYVADQKEAMPIDFIFDQQDGVDVDVTLFFDAIRAGAAKKVQKLIPNLPMFRDEKTTMPLQAADMVASEVRRSYEEEKFGKKRFQVPDARNPNAHLYGSPLPEELMVKWNQEHSAHPLIDKMSTKRGWGHIRKDMSLWKPPPGFVPPYGSKFRNWFTPLAIWATRFLRR